MTDLEKPFGTAKYKKLLEEIKFPFTPVENTEEPSPIFDLIRIFPYVSSLIKNLNEAEISGSFLAKLQHPVSHAAHTASNLSPGFRFASLGLQVLDFFRIPLLYLSAYMLGKEIPFKLSNNVKWLYAGVAIALTLTAIFVPGVAPVLGIVMGGIGLGMSIYGFTRFFMRKRKYAQELEKVKEELEELLKGKAEMEREANTFSEQEGYDSKNLAEKNLLKSRISNLYIDYEEYKKRHQLLYDKKKLLEKKQKSMDLVKGMDRSLGVMLSGVALLGLVLSLFFPPVGLGLIIAATAAGALYITGRFAYIFMAKPEEKKSPEVPSSINVEDSTHQIEDALHPLEENYIPQSMPKFENLLASNTHTILATLHALVRNLEPQEDIEELKELLSEKLDELREALSLVQENKILIKPSDAVELCSNEGLNNFLLGKHINLKDLLPHEEERDSKTSSEEDLPTLHQ